MSRIIYKFQIEDLHEYGKVVRELKLKCLEPNEFKFQAGQFVMLHVPTETKPVLRAYSIASDDRVNNGFRLIFKFVEGGLASHYVWGLKGAEQLSFTGPFGKLFFPANPPKQLIFVSTSTGLAPHLSYLESKSEQYPDLDYRFLIGVRNEEDIFCSDVLENFKKKLPHFSYEFVVSRPNSNWQGKKGYVQDFLNEYSFFTKPTSFYLCGNTNMIEAVKKYLQERSFEKTNIISESFD